MENNWMDLMINIGTWLGCALVGFALGLKFMAKKGEKEPGMYCTLLKNGRVIMTPEEYKDLKREAVRSPRSKLERKCRAAKVIAVDFDGTLCGEGWEINPWLIDQLKEAKRRGAKLILHTSRTGSAVDWAVEFSKSVGVEFDKVVGDKPIADLYIDDKAVESVWPIDF